MELRQGSVESLAVMLNPQFWCGKRVLLTGHTGFKGTWLALWLQRLGAIVTGISLPPGAGPNLFELARIENSLESHFCDIRDADSLAKIVRRAKPDIVFHLAAQALVRASYKEPLATLSSNIMGTAHLLDALRGLISARVAVMITTDKVYQNNECLYPFREDDALGGHDPYSASKGASEFVIASYREAFLKEQGTAVASARAGNVIGGGDWSADRLIPDAIRAWQRRQSLEIRRPHATRPWQHVLEPLSGYLILAQKLWHEPGVAGAFNFGPGMNGAASVKQIVELARAAYGEGDVIYGDGTGGPHEAACLALETSKARSMLGVIPRWNLPETMEQTISWYRAQREGADAKLLCLRQIASYEAVDEPLYS